MSMGWINCKNARTCGLSICFEEACKKYDPKENSQQTNADRMIRMLQENDASGLLDWWQEILEDGVPSEDYFKWWLEQPAEGE